MNFRATAILFGAVVVLVGGLLVLALTEPKELVGGGLVEPLTRAAMTPKDVDTVEITRASPSEQKLLFVRTGDATWALKEPVTARMDGPQVQAVIKALFDAKPVSHPDMSPSLAVLGLDKPTLRVTLKAGDKDVTVNLGQTTIGADRAVTFVTASDRPTQPMAVRRSDLAPLFKDAARGQDGPAAPAAKWLTDYRTRRLLGVDLQDPVATLKGVRLIAGGKELVLARKAGASNAWDILRPAGYGSADVGGDPNPNVAAFTGVRMLLNAVTNFQPGGTDDYIEDPGDLAKYGLKDNDPNVIRVELFPEKGKDEALLIGKPVEENGKPVVPAKVYTRLEGDSAVVKVQTDKIDQLRQTILDPAVLRNRDLFADGARDKIDALDVSAGGGTVKLRKVPVGPSPKWVLYGGPNDPQEAYQAAVDTLVTAITRPRAASEILPAPNDAAFAGPELKAQVRVWVSGIAKPPKAEGTKPPAEPAVTGDPVTILVGKKDGDKVFVRKIEGGTKTDYKFPDSLVAVVAKTRLDFLDPSFAGFSPTVVTKLTIAGPGGKVTEVAKGKDDKWTFTQPADLKGKDADPDKLQSVLSAVATTTPDKVVSDAATPDELKKLGLDPARVTVTVGLPDGLEGVYAFGADLPDGGFVYAKQKDRAVVRVLKAMSNRFETDDLRDLTVSKLDPAKIDGFKLRGWQKDGKETELLLEKKGDTWTGKETVFERKADKWEPTGPAKDFAVDPAKVSRFLNAIAAPKAGTMFPFVPGKNYGVSANDPGRLAVEFGPPATALVFGSPAEGGTRYAQSSVHPGQILTLPAETVNAMTVDPNGFKK